MKLKINREQMLKSLTVVLHGIASKTPIPVMSNVKMELDEKFTACNNKQRTFCQNNNSLYDWFHRHHHKLS